MKNNLIVFPQSTSEILRRNRRPIKFLEDLIGKNFLNKIMDNLITDPISFDDFIRLPEFSLMKKLFPDLEIKRSPSGKNIIIYVPYIGYRITIGRRLLYGSIEIPVNYHIKTWGELVKYISLYLLSKTINQRIDTISNIIYGNKKVKYSVIMDAFLIKFPNLKEVLKGFFPEKEMDFIGKTSIGIAALDPRFDTIRNNITYIYIIGDTLHIELHNRTATIELKNQLGTKEDADDIIAMF